MRLGLRVAPADQILDPAEIGAAEALEIRHEDEIRREERPLLSDAHSHVERLVEHAEDRVVSLPRRGILTDIHRDDAVGEARVPDHVRGHVVEDASVDEDLAADPDRREHAGDGHRGAKGLGQPARVEHHQLGAVEVGRHAPEGRRHRVEVGVAAVGGGEPVKQQFAFLGGAQSGRQAEPAAQAEPQRRGKRPRVLLAAKRLVEERRVRREHAGPIDVLDQFPDLPGPQSSRERAADQSAHARAAHDVHRHAVLVEPLQDADVGESTRPAAAERQADPRATGGRPGLRLRGGLGGGLPRQARREGQNRHGGRTNDGSQARTHTEDRGPSVARTGYNRACGGSVSARRPAPGPAGLAPARIAHRDRGGLGPRRHDRHRRRQEPPDGVHV